MHSRSASLLLTVRQRMSHRSHRPSCTHDGYAFAVQLSMLQLMNCCFAQIALLVSATTPLSVRGEEGECSSRGLYEGEFFPGVGKIEYEGAESTNPLSFHYYNADEVIMGKPMKEW